MFGAALFVPLLALAQPRCLPFEDASPARAPEPVVVAAPARAVVVAAPARAVGPAALARAERAHYRIDYGVIPIGELELAIARGAPGATSVRAAGHGAGGVLGLGHMENQIATEFDLARLDSRRWVDARSGGDRDLSDSAEQPTSGDVTFVRELADAPRAPVTARARLAGPVVDPIGFLLRLRVAPPSAAVPQIIYVLDGQALWRVTVTRAGRELIATDAAPAATVRLDAEAEPLFWNGTVDAAGDRHHRTFHLWLSDDELRVPLRLEMPLGIATVVVALTQLDRA
jgi:hypothetical protein